MGDALAISLLETRGFTREDFAMSHPAGQLGRRLLVHIEDIMHKGEEIPSVNLDASISQAIVEMTAKRLGMTAILDSGRKVAGIYTDGDLRRTLDAGLDPHKTKVRDVMTPGGQSIAPGALAMEAMQKMQAHSVQGLLVISDDGELVGALNFQDLLKVGIV
jgi:arabinose-5-phosphate isomerase